MRSSGLSARSVVAAARRVPAPQVGGVTEVGVRRASTADVATPLRNADLCQLRDAAVVQAVGRAFQQQRRHLQRSDRRAPLVADGLRDLLEPFQRSRSERHEAPLSPRRIRASTAPGGLRKRVSTSAANCIAPKHLPPASTLPRRAAPRPCAIFSMSREGLGFMVSAPRR